MTFILSPAIIDEIIFAMENQTECFLFDALEGLCVNEDTIDDAYETSAGGERYYNLPEWSSAQGFRVMEQFTARVHNPLLREALENVLEHRKGVFRQYKAVLKTAPAIEQDWYRFKETHMKAAVYEWYNRLRMIWGLEKISFEEEVESQLLPEDFTFQVQKNAALDAELLQDFIRKTDVPFDTDADVPDSAQATAAEVCRRLGYAAFLNEVPCDPAWSVFKSAQDTTTLIAAYSDSGLCAICVVLTFPSEHSLCIPFLRTLPEYRGLGLGKELLSRACAYAEQTHATVLLFADFCVPAYFIPRLERHGFKQTGLFYAKDMDEMDEEHQILPLRTNQQPRRYMRHTP